MHWVQRSVFEGELTNSQFNALNMELKSIINKKEDSVIFYAIRNSSVFDKKIIGKELNEISNYI